MSSEIVYHIAVAHGNNVHKQKQDKNKNGQKHDRKHNKITKNFKIIDTFTSIQWSIRNMLLSLHGQLS